MVFLQKKKKIIAALEIIYEDEEIWVVNKPAGMSSQRDLTEGATVVDLLDSEYIITRLDKRVSGLMVVAKTKAAASEFSEFIRTDDFSKAYFCVIPKALEKEAGRLVHWLKKEKGKASVYDKERRGAKKAILNYRLISSSERYQLLQIQIETGRFHQIRAQMAHIGCPIVGDLKYGAKRNSFDGSIFLSCCEIIIRKKKISIPFPDSWVKYGFSN